MSEKVKITDAEAVEKHNRRLKGALGDMRAGVERVTEAPTVKAAAAKADWVARMADPEVQGRWERGLKRVDLASWKKDMIEKGVVRVSGGIDRAKDKMTDFYGKLFSYQNTALPTIAKMPKLTKSDTKARMDAWFDKMSDFKYK